MRASFRFQIFPASGVPIYRQLIDQILTQIASGLLTPGAFLPTVRAVAEDMQINPMTVSKAYSILERDGILTLCHGQGMRVNPRKEGGSVHEGQKELLPHAQQMVAKAYQLSLTADQVQSVLKPLLKDLKS